MSVAMATCAMGGSRLRWWTTLSSFSHQFLFPRLYFAIARPGRLASFRSPLPTTRCFRVPLSLKRGGAGGCVASCVFGFLGWCDICLSHHLPLSPFVSHCPVYYFRMYASAILFGLFNGLVLFPVILSLIGPPSVGDPGLSGEGSLWLPCPIP